MSEHPFRVCWTAQQTRSMLVTEALEGDDAVFLATHTPIHGFEVSGTSAADLEGADEQAVLTSLSDPDREHAFCVVQGEPGSGKSHLIRWLSVNWPKGKDVKLLLRRADGSLEGALRQLKERLPEEFHEHFEGLGTPQRATLKGRANIFLNTLSAMMAPGHFEEEMPDERWCERYRPDELLGNSQIRSQWSAPSRILTLLDGADGNRDQQSASFNVFDVAELGDIAYKYSSQLLGGAKKLGSALATESDKINSLKRDNWLPDEIASEIADEIPTTLELIASLNRRRNDAIQNVLGVSAQGLKTLFRKVRQALATRDMRLVLLLEDITSWEGLDDSLIDVLVFNATARGDEAEQDVCPLISVVGLTPAYYRQLQANYRQRITHEIRLGEMAGGDVDDLEGKERVAFVSRYLNAVRAGSDALRAWRTANQDSRGLEPPPNPCNACAKQESCFKTFGDSEGVGLFPFTETALARFYEALKVDDDGQTWRTPRGILQAVVVPNLSQPELLEQQRFPGPLIEHSAFEPSRKPDIAVAPRLGQIIAAQIEDDDQARRYRRLVTYWGNPESADTVALEGELAFAGVTRTIFEAFGMPWIGQDQATMAGPAVVPSPAPPSQEPSPATEETKETEVAEPGEQRRRLISEVTSRNTNRTSVPPRNRGPTRNKREQMRLDLAKWVQGKGLENASQWNGLLHLLVDSLDKRSTGVAPFLFDKIITQEMVKLHGSTSGSRDYLVIPPEEWVRVGLESYLTLDIDRDTLGTEDRAFHLRNLSILMRRLETLAVDYLERRLPLTEDSKIWSPVGAMTQVLQARAWLRGVLDPKAEPIDQLRNILSDEDEAVSDPGARSKPWNDWLNATKNWHERIRADLRQLISTESPGLIDSSETLAAIMQLRDSGFMVEAPEADLGLPENMRKAKELAGYWNKNRSTIASVEFKQIKDRAEALDFLLRKASIESHLDRLDKAITQSSNLLPNVAFELVASWKAELPRATERNSERFPAVEELIDAFLDDDEIPAKLPLRIAWLSEQPARELQDILELARSGEKAVQELRDHARDCVSASGKGVSLSAIHEIGRRIKLATGLD